MKTSRVNNASNIMQGPVSNSCPVEWEDIVEPKPFNNLWSNTHTWVTWAPLGWNKSKYHLPFLPSYHHSSMFAHWLLSCLSGGSVPSHLCILESRRKNWPQNRASRIDPLDTAIHHTCKSYLYRFNKGTLILFVIMYEHTSNKNHGFCTCLAEMVCIFYWKI